MFKFDPSTNSIDNYVSKITNVDSAFKTKIKIEMYKLVHTNNKIFTLYLSPQVPSTFGGKFSAAFLN